jgi:protein involved in polysaccharide export with SLBB domain
VRKASWRWQFSLLSLFVVVTIAAVVSWISKGVRDSAPRPIQIGDTLSVTTTGTNDDWGSYIVRRNGTIRLPTGVVPVAGCSDEEARSAIEAHLKQIYRNPTVSLKVRRDGDGKMLGSRGPASHTSHLRGYVDSF